MKKINVLYCENIYEFKKIKIGDLSIDDHIIMDFKVVYAIIQELNLLQPERLNPEDVRNNVCDSPNTTNK